MDDFLQVSALLRAKHQRPPSFNIFSVLRSASDEVRLHSRFIAFLLDPKASHNQGTALLNLLLKRLSIHDFDSESAIVEVEYKNIDVLVRNQSNQAVIIENKIYARDRDGQLWDYHHQMRGEGYRDIWTSYLTLKGDEPSAQSKRSLTVILLSYEAEIISWLKDCIPLVAREPGVRESIFQYIELLQKLTSSDQSEIYMEKLKNHIRLGDNIFVIADINHAFKSILADLQFDIWTRIRTYQSEQYPYLGKPEITATKEAVSDFYTKIKNNKLIGLLFPFNFMKGGVYIEVNHRLYAGYYCDGELYPEDRERLFELSRDIAPRRRNTSTLFWRYSKINVNLHAPSNEDLGLLRDPEQRESIAVSLVGDVHELWQRAHQKFA